MIVTLKEREEVQLCKAEQAAINDTNQLQCNKQIRQEKSIQRSLAEPEVGSLWGHIELISELSLWKTWPRSI